tara:strand:+ start:2575 stop:3564 length:990 start_codon:yes stop_codon:yes gene_type:complete
MKNKIILITGCAGFVGFHTAKKYCQSGSVNIIGLDNLNDYYDISLKQDRLNILNKFNNFSFIKVDLKNTSEIKSIFENNNISFVVHLAAQAGVRYSIENPYAYIDSNIYGFLNILEGCKKNRIPIIYASSSSVYGNSEKGNDDLYNESIDTDNPLSIYGFTKRANELMAKTYFNLFQVKSIGLRFFTVYGSFGRPDMAYFMFTKKILNDETIDVYNNGNHVRSFTHIDDVINALDKLISYYIVDKHLISCHTFNICSDEQISLMNFINILEKELNKKANINFLPKQLGDVHDNNGDFSLMKSNLNWTPEVKFEVGIKDFISWYKKYYSR